MPSTYRKFFVAAALAAVFFVTPGSRVTSAPVFNSASSQSKVIFLTLDADMNEPMARRLQQHKLSSWYDPRIFDYLEKNKIPATFFVSGLFVETYPSLTKSLAENPLFSLQNHSYDESGFIPHCYGLHALATKQEKIDQVKKTQDILQKLTGKQPQYFRYPGLCSGPGDDDIIKNLGLQINEGNIIASDPFNRNTDKIVSRVLAGLKNNGVIVMHVGGPNAPASYDVLRRIAPKIRARGFQFEVLAHS